MKPDLSSMSNQDLGSRWLQLDERGLHLVVLGAFVGAPVLIAGMIFTLMPPLAGAVLPMMVAGGAVMLGCAVTGVVSGVEKGKVNAEIKRREALAAAGAGPPDLSSAPSPAQKPATPDFNNEAAVTLDKDVSKMRIKLHPRQASLDF